MVLTLPVNDVLVKAAASAFFVVGATTARATRGQRREMRAGRLVDDLTASNRSRPRAALEQALGRGLRSLTDRARNCCRPIGLSDLDLAVSIGQTEVGSSACEDSDDGEVFRETGTTR
jgi:hypothetical protein